MEAVRLGFSLAEAAELVGCSKSTVGAWALAAGAGRPGRGGAVHLPYDEKAGLVARYEAGERAADLGREAGVTVIPSTFFSPIAQMNRHRSRQRIFTGSANGLSPFSAILRPSSRAAGPSAGRTCP